jgi:SAM-dependent methyltransferase
MDVDQRTIRDFGEQWTTYQDADGFFGSLSLLADFIAPFSMECFRGARVADIGAGTGRFVLSLLEAGAANVVAVEPSASAAVVREKVRNVTADRVSVLNIPGENLPSDLALDYAISVGVLHHVTRPQPVVAAVYRALKPGGKFVIWLYGKEGNRLYLTLVLPLRLFSKHLPHQGKAFLAHALSWPLGVYIAICTRWPKAPLPLRQYMVEILGRLDSSKRRLVIYDQLNPHYAKYYTGEEARQLMASAPFDVALHHRKGYSWVVIGTKPARDTPPTSAASPARGLRFAPIDAR